MSAPVASISALMMSIASSAAMAMGLAPHPENGQLQIEPEMAKFNIDLLLVLRDKTRGNLTEDESRFLENVLGDLQLRFVDMNRK